ncbi:MAG: hypothetical protein JXN60_03330 [Lentisphaerae bacterium]|nr:hypothetical protein [Lentisphaerota bacterium]
MANDAARAPITVSYADDLVRSWGLIFSNTFLYGPSHGVTVKAMADGYMIMTKCLAECPDITFQLTDDSRIIVNEQIVEQKNPLVRMFYTHLRELDILTFSIEQGMSEDAFKNLMEVLNAKPDEIRQLGGFAGTIASLGIQNVRAKKVSYQKVTEDEMVVDKDAMDGADQAQAALEDVVAFLSGGGSEEKHEGVVKAVENAASDAEKFGDLIVQAADSEEKRDGSGAEGEDFADRVVKSLKRAFDGLSETSVIKTKKGRKSLIKTLTKLEKEILARIRNVKDGVNEEQVKKVSEAIETMTEELQIDELATEYVKKASAADENEKRLLKFMQAKGVDGLANIDLQERLISGGLSPDAWSDLLNKSGIAGSGGGIAAVGHLAMLLAEMEKNVGEGQLSDVLEGVHAEVRKMVVRTERKILDLVESMRDEDEAGVETDAAADGKMTKRRMLTILAEIAQELCQPLAVMNCSIDMLKSGTIGQVNEQQTNMLSLALESGAKLGKLIDRLTKISGLPTTMSPDANIQRYLYEPES